MHRSGDANELKQFAGMALPVLKEDLKMALALTEKGNWEDVRNHRSRSRAPLLTVTC